MENYVLIEVCMKNKLTVLDVMPENEIIPYLTLLDGEEPHLDYDFCNEKSENKVYLLMNNVQCVHHDHPKSHYSRVWCIKISGRRIIDVLRELKTYF